MGVDRFMAGERSRARYPALWLSESFCFVLAALLGLLASGCEPQVAIQGLVTDTSGAPLPGVSIKVNGTERFAVSNGRGVYGKRPGRLTVPPGSWELRYVKTGFTTAEQTIDTGDARDFEAPGVVLWPVPSARGVYDFGDDYRFVGWTRVEPERFLREDRSAVFGTRQSPEVTVGPALGRIVAHKVPPYDWRLSRLEQVPVLRDAAGGGENAAAELVWTESVRIGVQAVPLDEPERLLWELRPARALGPGVYAVHWGALAGDPTTEASAYLVEVKAAVVAEPLESESPPAGAQVEN